MGLREIIIKEFGRDYIYPMSAVRDEELFRKIMNMVGPIKCCIEIGTYIGISTCLLAEFAEEVHTYDIRDLPLREKIWERFKIGHGNMVFHLIKDNSEKIFPEFDFAFIDGRHADTGPEVDFELTKKCGRVLFHDYEHGWAENDIRSNVIRFVDSIEEGNIHIDEPFALWTAIGEKILWPRS